MFNSKRINDIEKKIIKLEERQVDFIKHIDTILNKLISESKGKYVWELRQQEIEMIEDGKNMKIIRKILS